MDLSCVPLITVLFTLLITFPKGCSSEVIKLDQAARWSLNNVHGFNNVSLKAITVPSYALELLQNHGILHEDFLFRFNERDFAWVAADTWTYTARWNTPSDKTPNLSNEANESIPPRTLLILHGIDTAADVFLNHKRIGFIANAHRQHTFDVTEIIHFDPGYENILEITIQPASEYAASQARSVPYPIPYTKQLGSTGQYNFIRKPASDFGWDWGPSFAPSGISGPVELITTKTSALIDVGIRQEYLTNGSILVTADVFFRPMGLDKEVGGLEMRIFKPGSEEQWVQEVEIEILANEVLPLSLINSSKKGQCSTCTCSTSSNLESPPNPSPRSEQQKDREIDSVKEESSGLGVMHSVRIIIPNASDVDFWWPWDLSSTASRLRNAPATPVAALYNVTVTYSPRRGYDNVTATADGAVPLDFLKLPQQAQHVVERRIGFRTVTLVRQPTGTRGETFQFLVNGVPVFARGANVVPMDVLETKVNERRIKKMVTAAKAANMNMLRVWGGGRYFQGKKERYRYNIIYYCKNNNIFDFF